MDDANMQADGVDAAAPAAEPVMDPAVEVEAPAAEPEAEAAA